MSQNKITRFNNNAGFTLVENLISMALLATVAVSISPVFVNSGKTSKGSNVRETCQRLVNAKISAYRSMTQADLLLRYNTYRANTTLYPDSTYNGIANWNKLCGHHSAQVYSTAFPMVTQGAQPTPPAGLSANIKGFLDDEATYGRAPAVGVRECVQLNPTPGSAASDTFADAETPAYPSGACGAPTNIRAGDRAAIAALPGFKMYTSLSVVNPWGGARAYSCPAAPWVPTGMNQSIEVVVSAVADYASIGAPNAAGEVDPAKLMCSARGTIPLVTSANTAQFRYYAHSGAVPPYPTPANWEIKKIGAGVAYPGGGTPTPVPVYKAVSDTMNTWIPRNTGQITPGTVTQFGISPSGLRAFFVKAYEATSSTSDYMTSYYCAVTVSSGETQQSPDLVKCFTLPQLPTNQIEYVVLDYQGGKMWGVLGRYANPNRHPTPASATSQDLTGAVLLADCSNHTTTEAREAALFDLTGCGTVVAVPVHFTMNSNAYTTEALMTDYLTRKLDMNFLTNSPDLMWGSTPNPALPGGTVLSRDHHIPVRSLRDVPILFRPDGAFYKVVQNKRDCISLQPTPGAKHICTQHAYARLFFSPDALSAYAVMRYPKNAANTTDPGTGSPDVTCPSSTAYTNIDRLVRVYKLEIPNAAGSTDNEYVCPNVVATYNVGASDSATHKYILISF